MFLVMDAENGRIYVKKESRVYDYSDWSGDYRMEDTVTINP